MAYRCRSQADLAERFSLRNHYRGDEFQLGMTDFLSNLGWGPTLDRLEAYSWAAETEEDRAFFEACLPEVERFHGALDAVTKSTPVDLVGGAGASGWAVPLDKFASDLDDELEALDVCGEFKVHREELDIELHATVIEEGDRRRIEWGGPPGGSRDYSLLLTIWMVPDASVGAPPAQPMPESLFTFRSMHLVAIDFCGELPWSYTNLAASDSYSTGPTWPSPIDSAYPCPRPND